MTTEPRRLTGLTIINWISVLLTIANFRDNNHRSTARFRRILQIALVLAIWIAANCAALAWIDVRESRILEAEFDVPAKVIRSYESRTVTLQGSNGDLGHSGIAFGRRLGWQVQEPYLSSFTCMAGESAVCRQRAANCVVCLLSFAAKTACKSYPLCGAGAAMPQTRRLVAAT